jgi:hypothetical protein
MNGSTLALTLVGALAVGAALGRRDRLHGSSNEPAAPPYRVTGPTTGVFTRPTTLYRVLDRFELEVLAARWMREGDVAAFEGGYFSVSDERAGGASFGASRDDVIRFGRGWARGKGSRLRGPLYVVAVEAEGLPFSHLDLKSGKTTRELCSTMLGCSIRPRVIDVREAWALDRDGAPRDRHAIGHDALTKIDWFDAIWEHQENANSVLRVAVALDDLNRSWDALLRVIYDVTRRLESLEMWKKPRLTQEERAAGTDAAARVQAALEVIVRSPYPERAPDTVARDLKAWKKLLKKTGVK